MDTVNRARRYANMPITLQRSRAGARRHMRPSSGRFTRVSIRGNGRTHTYALSKRRFEDLIEDLEALSSPKYLASIRRARKDVAAGRTHTLADVKRQLGIA